jgi:serine/threonine protein kinase
VWDFDDEHEFPHVVLELVEGLSLAQLIQQSGRLSEARAVALTGQVAQALEAAWQLGVVHRDVKPGNILLDREGAAKLADLGLACSVEGSQGARPKSAAGTVAYMAPEQAMGREIDHRSDIYALGATLFHMVTGRLPFPGASWQEVIYKHTNQPLDPPEMHAPGLSQDVSELIVAMMMKSPEDRPQSYRELRQTLDEAGGPVAPAPAMPRTSRSLPTPPAAEPVTASAAAPTPPRSRWLRVLRGLTN